MNKSIRFFDTKKDTVCERNEAFCVMIQNRYEDYVMIKSETA